MFETLQPAPADKILALIGLYRADTRSNKVDLGVGVYKDSDGRTPVMRAVNRVVSRVLGRATAAQNVATEQVGIVNRLNAWAHRTGERRKRFKRRFPLGYQLARIALGLFVAGWLLLPLLRR